MYKWGLSSSAAVLVGGQFGSEGKGQVAAYLATIGERFNVATTNAGAQAGHTTNFRLTPPPSVPAHFVCFHLPTTAVVQKQCLAYINAGSIIDVDVLIDEIKACHMEDRVFIHPRATVIQKEDRDAERAVGSSVSKIASTQKGVGAAIANKIMRRSKLAGDAEELRHLIRPPEDMDLNELMYMRNGAIVVEVPQGLGLSLNHGLAYPYTTSRDCWVGSGISDAGIHPEFVTDVCMVMRTFPIRVGDFYNEAGELIGSSGPFWTNSTELDWATHFPGIEPERTTVTKRVRRIATWSDEQYTHALSINRPTIVALTFCDYLTDAEEFMLYMTSMHTVEDNLNIRPIKIFSFGPHVEDMTDDAGRAMAWYDHRQF